MFEKIQALVNAEAQTLLGKLLPNLSAADQADIQAILPHLEAIIWRDLGVKLLQKLAAKVPAAQKALDVVTQLLNPPAATGTDAAAAAAAAGAALNVAK